MGTGISIDFLGANALINTLDAYPRQATDAIKELMGEAASKVYMASQASVPVDKGDLQSSAYIDIVDGPTEFHVDVTYGDGNGYGSKYGIEDGYAWFVELGHLSRAGNLVPPQPYLSPAFDMEAQNLQSALQSLAS